MSVRHPNLFATENVAKGRNDRPEVDVIIAECGELQLDLPVDEEGKEVPIHAEL
jgi:peptidyl-prolyl cis-trans isomerase B (cyclophilin B)